MDINREPTVIIGGIAEIIRAIIPMLLVFGTIHWTDVQTGAVVLVVGVVVGVAEKLFARSQTVSTTTANAQIAVGLRSDPNTTTIEQVIAKTEKELT